jgi:hypothetical protein
MASASVSNERYEIAFKATFDGDVLDEHWWSPYYLPQWSSRERFAARYEVALAGDGGTARVGLGPSPARPS